MRKKIYCLGLCNLGPLELARSPLRDAKLVSDLIKDNTIP